MKIRAFRAAKADYEGLVAIERAVWPDRPVTLEMLEYRDRSRDTEYYFHRALVEISDQIVAVGSAMEPSWSYRPGKYHLDITVLPDFERRGIGTEAYRYLTNLIATRTPAPALLTSGSREDKPQAVHFLEERGYSLTMRWPRSTLDLTIFDPEPFRPKADAIAAAGIEIFPVSELRQRDPDWQRKLYDLDWAGIQDEPSPDKPTRLPFEQYVKEILESPEFMAEGYFVAVDNGAYVGMSELLRNPAGNKTLFTGFTCVVRSHRRRGVATALKLRALEHANSLGTQLVMTGNEENNPMYQINLNLGFKPAPAWLAFEKKVQ